MILHENKPRGVGLIVASLILLNAGVFPLIAATIGFIRIVYVYSITSTLLWAFVDILLELH